VEEQATEVERMIIQQIIRHGEMVIVDEDTEDAGLVRFNVAQYVSYDFGNDGLSFSNPLYNRVLQEAVEHSEDHGFKAEIYFTQHPDLEMSQLAHRMAVDNYQLGRNFAKEMTPKDLRQMVDHLILDFRYNYIKNRMKEVMNEMKTEKDMTRIRELMEEYQSTSELFRQIGKMLGR
jgi:DNA primase